MNNRRYDLESTNLDYILHLIFNNQLSMQLPIQRDERWDPDKQIKAVHSAITGFMPFSIVVIIIKFISYIADGKQRIISLIKFKNGWIKFPNNSELTATYKDKNGKLITFKLAGCGYEDLPEELKNNFNNSKVIKTIYQDLTDEEIVELFMRINSGMPLNSSERYITILFEHNKKLLYKIKDLCKKYNNEFFLKIMTPKSIRAEEDILVILRTLCMFIHTEDSTGIERSAIINTIKSITADDVNKVEKMIQTILKSKVVFKNKEIGSKKALPYILIEMKYASNIDKYLEYVNKFFDDKYKKQMIGLYNEYGSSTTSKRCVNHRRNIFRNIAKNCNSGMYYDYLLNNTNTESNSKNNTVNVNINM